MLNKTIITCVCFLLISTSAMAASFTYEEVESGYYDHYRLTKVTGLTHPDLLSSFTATFYYGLTGAEVRALVDGLPAGYFDGQAPGDTVRYGAESLIDAMGDDTFTYRYRRCKNGWITGGDGFLAPYAYSDAGYPGPTTTYELVSLGDEYGGLSADSTHYHTFRSDFGDASILTPNIVIFTPGGTPVPVPSTLYLLACSLFCLPLIKRFTKKG